MTMPAAVINFTKSRLDIRGLLLVEPPRLSSITCPETCVHGTRRGRGTENVRTVARIGIDR
jgi:hypothetical protein